MFEMLMYVGCLRHMAWTSDLEVAQVKCLPLDSHTLWHDKNSNKLIIKRQ